MPQGALILTGEDPASEFSDGRLTIRRRPGVVRTRSELIERAWGPDANVREQSVDVFVKRLRAKLSEEIPDVTYIHTHFGFGYRFDPQPMALPRRRLRRLRGDRR